MSNNLQGKRVLIFLQRGWGVKIGHFLAKNLKAEGSRLAALTLKRTTHKFALRQSDVRYELIINEDEIKGRPQDYLAGERYSLDTICKDLGVDSIWPLVSSLRLHVRSYKDKFYYGFKQNVPDEGLVDYVMAVYKCVKTVFEKFNPEIILAPNFGDLMHIMFNLYAAKRGVRMLTVTDCKVKGLMIFAEDYNETKGSFYERVDELNRGIVSPNLERARKYIADFRANPQPADQFSKQEQKTGWAAKLKSELRPWYQIWKWYKSRPINVMESTGITPDYRPPRIILRDHFARKRYKRFMDRCDYYPFDKIGKFVYFPLQFQPEVTIDVIAPYFSNQIETARQVAMSLPGDYTLLVKEHPAMVGLRPPSYLEKVARTPNVKLVQYRIPGAMILKRADLVISPNSSSIVEAAFFHKPAIQLGNLGTTLKLPNVFKHTDMTTLPQKIKEVLKVNLVSEDYERRLTNYVAAAYDTGLMENYWGFWDRSEKMDLEVFWQFWKKEIAK